MNGDGKALVSADVVATALRMDGDARQIVEASERANRAFALHGNIYKHYHYKDASYSCLAEGTCFANYIAFQSRMYADEFGASEPVPPAQLGVLSTILEENRLIQTARRLEEEAVSRIRAAPVTWIGGTAAQAREFGYFERASPPSRCKMKPSAVCLLAIPGCRWASSRESELPRSSLSWANG